MCTIGAKRLCTRVVFSDERFEDGFRYRLLPFTAMAGVFNGTSPDLRETQIITRILEHKHYAHAAQLQLTTTTPSLRGRNYTVVVYKQLVA